MKKMEQKKTFVIAKKKIKIPNDLLIEKGDVGIVELETQNTASIFFIRVWEKVELNKDDFQVFDVKKTGDAFPKKICNICHKLLDSNKFAKNQNGINNRSVRRPSCADCRKHLEGINMSTKTKAEWAKKKPQNIPFECPICSKRTIAGVTCKVVLDHNHRNGEARGWVCDSCNTGIGRFKDDIELIKKAIKFIE
ncbi:MAG: endonuclease [Candidatus Magasanikbacteria bacterium CG10_big_fil_rev_8_21_14_0_10_36_16]|uniref:Endonuclease n=1 Tax=Candidatus Magasanikbacteria bacterium CG10_big_fil_rev_8_21_14_0_10_36_16 TaxID=1974645 RepID=A0A2H0TXP6_9BACT|nr:MAG: endonuclease [Candidatus Magasanikbacteria bacterium CG10_big_fil_rev_8_21_14_0_10_36_16]